MTDYTKITDFAAKDTLPTGSAGKIIRGSEFETEFDNISTAIATKADIDGQTMTNVDIDSGAIDGTAIGANSASTGAFSSLTATTADIDGGTIDGTNIGATTAGTAEFTSLTAGGLVYPTSDGTADQVLTTDGSGNLSFADTLQGEMTLDLTADGAGVAANRWVKVNPTGTVTEITGNNPDVSSDITVEQPRSGSISGKLGLVYVSSANKWIYVGQDNNYYVLDLTGENPSISSGVSLPGSGTVENYHWNSTESLFVVLRGTDIYAATLSGSTLTFGSAADVSGSSYTGADGGDHHLLYDPRSGTSIFVWTGYTFSEITTIPGEPPEDFYQWDDFDGHVLSFTGTTITIEAGQALVGTLPASYSTLTTLVPQAIYNHVGASKSFLVWNESSLSTWKAVTLSVSGSTITTGTTENSLTNLNGSSRSFAGAFYDSAQTDFLAMNDQTLNVITISGDTITAGSDVSIDTESGYTSFGTGPWAYNSSTSRYIKVIQYQSGNDLGIQEYAWNGTNLVSQSTDFDRLDYETAYYANVYDVTGDNLFIIASETGSSVKKGFFYNGAGSTNLESGKFVGFTQASAATGETVSVRFGYAFQGGFTGLTPSTTYYLDKTGALSSTADSPVVLVGRAITSTTLFMVSTG